MIDGDFSTAIDFADRTGYRIMQLRKFLDPSAPCLLEVGDCSEYEWDQLLARACIIKQEHGMPDSFWVFFDPDDNGEGFLLVGPTPDWLVGMASAYLDHLAIDDSSEKSLLRQIREQAMACPVTNAAAAMVGLPALRDAWSD